MGCSGAAGQLACSSGSHSSDLYCLLLRVEGVVAARACQIGRAASHHGDDLPGAAGNSRQIWHALWKLRVKQLELRPTQRQHDPPHWDLETPCSAEAQLSPLSGTCIGRYSAEAPHQGRGSGGKGAALPHVGTPPPPAAVYLL